VSRRDDDATWREIVDNYGDRPAVPAEPSGPAEPAAPDPAPPEPFQLELYDEAFVPPPLPPPPVIAPERRLAWVGLVAAPLLLVVVTVIDLRLPSVLTGGLVLAFLGSFGYLVATMSQEPRDPDDDGARL
jgi:hypothetical protein